MTHLWTSTPGEALYQCQTWTHIHPHDPPEHDTDVEYTNHHDKHFDPPKTLFVPFWPVIFSAILKPITLSYIL